MLDKFLPPTDNLYKFIAISGLMLIVFSFVPNYISFKFTEQQIGYIGNQYKFIVESDQLIKDINKQVENQKQLIRDLEELPKKTNGENNEKLLQVKKNLEEEAKKLGEKQIAMNLKEAELKTAGEYITFYDLTITRLVSLSVIIFLVGVFFVVVGFYFWYQKMQKPNDLILISQTKEQSLAKSKRIKRIRLI
jgi:hypothetical protein